MSEKILITNNYRLFELLPFNRDVKKIKSLSKSMTNHGWISAYPMNVIQNGNGKFKIKDGHHRFEVAQKLNIPVKYVVCTDSATVYELDKATNKWTLNDCLTSYCRSGKVEYMKVREYCEETGIGLSNALAMLYGHSPGTGNVGLLFRGGMFKINQNCNHAQIVKELVLTAKRSGVKFYNTNLLVHAFSKIAWVDNISIDRMKSKIKTFVYLIEKKANLDQYLAMLEEIYNRQSQKKIPLKYLAQEKAKERNVATAR